MNKRIRYGVNDTFTFSLPYIISFGVWPNARREAEYEGYWVDIYFMSWYVSIQIKKPKIKIF